MKKRVSLLIVLTMMVSLTGCNPKKTTMEHYLENVDAKYAYNISKALAEDDDLLSNELGYRSAGSDAEHKAADYIEKEMGKIGLETEKIPVTVDKWQFNSASLKIEGTDIQMMPASYQLSGTSKEGIVTEMVDVGNGTAADYEGKDVEGKIVLAGVDQFNVAWIDMYMEEAALHKAAALVTYDNGGYGTYDDDQINVQDVCCDDLIPTVAISKNNYKSIKKALKAGNLAFASMFVISVLAIIIQMLLTVDIRLVLGETATALVGGILYASIMVYNGIWDKCLPKSATIWRDFFTSVICAGIFTVIYGICLFRMGATETQITRLALGFLIGITIVAFIILRLLAFINRKRNQNSSNVQEKKETSISKAEWTKIYNAQNIVETEQLVEMLKQNGIAAFSQEAGANVAMHGAPGFGIYGVDIFVKTDDAEKAVQLIKEINNQE